jgi:hypothetical protein
LSLLAVEAAAVAFKAAAAAQVVFCFQDFTT